MSLSERYALSVIVAPSDNAADGLAQTLCSLDKCGGTIEAIVCDAYEHGFANNAPSFSNVHVKHIRTADRRAKAINEALNRCNATLVGILSPGDTYLSKTVEKVLQVSRESQRKQCFYSDTITIDLGSKSLGSFSTASDWRNRRRGHCRFSPPGVIYQKEIVLKAGCMNEKWKFWAEYDLWLRLDFAGCIFQYIPGPLAQHIVSSCTVSASDFSNQPTAESVREMLSVRALAGGGLLSWEHLAWYGATSAFFEAKQQGDFLRRFASALDHIRRARASWKPRPRASLQDNARILLGLFHRVWKKSPLQEFGLPSPSSQSAFQRFFTGKLFQLEHHAPRPIRVPRRYHRSVSLPSPPPTISIVTPSLNQGRYLESTILSVLNQEYPALEYVVQDGGSSDETVSILQNYSSALSSWESAPDAGQASAINRGFSRTSGEIMAYLNSDDLLLPGSLAYVARFFNQNPDIDVIYGHRVLIDKNGLEIGRWILPKHDNRAIAYADFIPQETLFWRTSAWKAVGERIDESFRFAMDYDLILRFRDAGLKFHRLPRFLGAFRVWQDQKTQSAWLSEGLWETRRLMLRTLGENFDEPEAQPPLKSYLRRHWWLDRVYRLKILHY